MELRTKSFGVRLFLLTFSISCLYVFLTAYPGKAFAESRGGPLPDFDLTSPELSARKQEETVDATVYKRHLASQRRLQPVKVNTSKQYYPIIFLPGVAGTRLYHKWYGLDKELWPATYPLHDITKLHMDENGVPKTKDVSAGDILMHGDELLSKLSQPIYGDLLKSIQSIKLENGMSYKNGVNLFPWGYDWRLDNSDHLSALDNFLKKNKLNKVILIAHSMGGLISRAYAVKYPDKVETIISIGSPFAGSPKPFYGLVMGYTFGNDYYVKAEGMKVLLQNTPSTYQLLPQYDFVKKDSMEIPNEDFYKKIKYKDPDSWKDWWSASNSWSMNTKLLEKAKLFYGIVQTSDNPVPLPSATKHYAIIGVGVKTLDGYSLKEASSDAKDYLDYNGEKVILTPQLGNGDGTVPLKSADIKHTTKTYFIHHGERPDASGEHGNLPNNKQVQRIVTSILLGNPDSDTGKPDSPNPVNTEPEMDFTLR